MVNLKRKTTNPNGNPNFKKRWGNLGEPSSIRLPRELHLLFKQLADGINSGKITITDLEKLCD